MGIDLFTLTAQVINLIILLFLLRKFLYLPVLKAVEARQKMIAEELKSAEIARRKAVIAEKECQKKIQDLEAQKQQILAKVRREAEDLSQQLNDKARDEYKNAQQQWIKRLSAEQANFTKAVQKMVLTHFNRFAVKAMEQMAGVELNDLLVQQLEQKIKQLPSEENSAFMAAFAHKREIMVETAGELSAERKKQLEEFLKKQWNLPASTSFLYNLQPELISGIAIRAEEQFVEWSLSGYLEDFRQNMEKEMRQLLMKGEK